MIEQWCPQRPMTKYSVQIYAAAILVISIILLSSCNRHKPRLSTAVLEKHIRAQYDIQPGVSIHIDRLRSPEFPHHELLKVTSEKDGERHVEEFLLASNDQSLIHLTTFNIAGDPWVENQRNIDIVGRPTLGTKNAKVMIVVYDDLECPYCARMYRILRNDTLVRYGQQIVVVYKPFPLGSHPWATAAAQTEECLGKQNEKAYWEFIDQIHSDLPSILRANHESAAQLSAVKRVAITIAHRLNLDTSKLSSCTSEPTPTELLKSLEEGKKLGVVGTPTLFINGEKISGVMSATELASLIDGRLRESGNASDLSTR